MTDGRRRRWFQSVTRRDLLVMLAAGGVAGLGHPPFDLFFLTIAGLGVAVLYLGRTQSPGQAWWLGWGLGVGYFAVSIHWIVEPFFVDPMRHGWMAPFAILFLSTGLGLFWALAFWATRRVSNAIWPLAVFLSLAELARAYVFGGFPWGMPGYVLVDSVGGQLASWLGPHGVNLFVFLLAWLVSVAASREGRQRFAPAIGAISVVAALFLTPRGDLPVATDAPVVRLVQPNAPQHLKWEPEHMRRFFDRAVLYTAVGETRPELIIWPETSVPVLLDRAGHTLDVIAEAAAGKPVVLGVNRTDGVRAYNSAVLMDAQGQVAQVYDKHHLVPFGEYIPLGNMLSWFGIRGFASQHGDGYSAGSGPVVMDLGKLGKALPLICYEAVFPQDVGGAAERPDFLMQVTNDAWFGNFSGPYQHLAQARMRAIEQGLPMVRAANTGVSAVISAKGRVTAFLPLNEEGYIDAALPPAATPTMYSRTGDLPLAFVLLVVTGLLTLRTRFKSD
ncbi:apolipoprotein N-acyltransferase [Shimia abyssi]|uniref:Apolipoprotein N-acyltransferase n=1 Tax=Shimia abyssi TaxID=1662395 RepID=A0A2P8FDK8_9RHOB|nr:apolipoprotein N-acyltransferase [Shimia abyssi]PSL19794.1 apolipoprotein N-acyltransferase [Shimia abyssi]